MILIYLPNKQIHQFFNGFGAVTTVNGTLHIDGNDTTTRAADVLWKYVADQPIERDENYCYVHNADYYQEIAAPVSESNRLSAVEQMLIEMQLGV